jgi:hypothetical protein
VVRSEISRVWATKRGGCATKQITLNIAPTTVNQGVTSSGSRQRHGDGDRTVRPRTQKIKIKSGTTPYPRGASASAPPKGRKEGGQRQATREEGGNERGRKQLCTRPAANTRSPAGTATSATTPQPKGHSRQEPSRQQQKQGGDKCTRSRKDPGATACKSGVHPQGQKIQHAAPGARAQPRPRQRQEIQDIKPQISRIRARRRGSPAAEEEMLDAAPPAFHKGGTPAVSVGGRVMQTWKLKRGQIPCNGMESQSTE